MKTTHLTVEQKSVTFRVTSPEHEAAFTVIIDDQDTAKHAAAQFKKLADYLRLSSSGTNCHRDSRLTVWVG